ncbi:MAG: ABC transporter permease, partial [Pseudomonadales bacterium]
FWRIALPSARPAIAGGLALVMMETAADFGVVEYFGVATFSTGIFRAWFGMGDKAAALQLAAGLFIVAGLLVLFERLGRRGQVANPVSRGQPSKRTTLTGSASLLASCYCALPVLLGFAVPVVILLRYAVTTGDPVLGTRFVQMLTNSFSVASVSALIATGFALVLCYAERLHGSRTVAVGTRIATLGYALPGAMLGLGVMVALIDIDHGFAVWRKAQFGGTPQLLLTGTALALVFAYVVRFLTVAYNTCHAGLSKIHPRLDDVGRTLGASPGELLQRVHLPLMRPAILTALLLVFIDVVKELPVTLILRPFNFETLATRVYQLAADERLPEASTAALCIVLLGLVPALLLSRSSRVEHQSGAGQTAALPVTANG